MSLLFYHISWVLTFQYIQQKGLLLIAFDIVQKKFVPLIILKL